jgi:serine/threonine protein kinase
MELCAGKLRDLVEGNYKGPPVGSGKEILIQIARAVHYLTGMNLINRNINPHTILISLPDDNMPPKIKLVDFSLSRKLGPGQTEMELSNVFQDHGMNDWTAPELLRNERNYTAAVDVFSAGCVFAYVLSGGKHPFGQKAAFRHANIATGNLQMPAEITDPSAIDLIQKMLAFDPSKRISIDQVLQHPFFFL